MIDTDKYEGHSVGKWRVRTRKGTFTVKDCLGDEVAAVNDYADARLIADAPLLLEEVKRLRLLFRELIYDMSADEYIEWCNRIGCPDGLEVEAMKND
tara:strand:+ start:547 stop:837 length:291 start_codon:yes stop_codon:yes gene_type:complete